MPSYKDLDAWQLAHRLTLAVYALTERFPKHERFGLTAQLRRAAYSIPTNIAEGSGRFSKKDYRRFVAMAAASASEVEYQLQLGADLGYCSQDEARRLQRDAERVRRMLYGLGRHLASADA